MLGSSERKKRVRIDAREMEALISALALSQGYEVVHDGDVDLWISELPRTEDPLTSTRARPAGEGGRALVLTRRRLREAEARALRGVGFDSALDGDASVLDLFFAFSDLLFASTAEQRRYGRTHTRSPVRITPAHDREMPPESSGRLVLIARPGALLEHAEAYGEGTVVDLHLDVAGREIPLRGRVVFSPSSAEKPNQVAIEFALEEPDVAPKLYGLCDRWWALPRSEDLPRTDSADAPMGR